MRKKRRTIKKYSVTWWKHRLDKKYNPLITSVKKCAKCKRMNGVFHCSHVYPKQVYQGIRYDPMNALCLCGQCHKWFWHDNPLDAYAWFRINFPERYTYLQEAKKMFIKRNQEYYEKVDKALNEKNIKDLMVYKLPLDKQCSL